jgi:thiol-disulfide isomerase/thioredoxin
VLRRSLCAAVALSLVVTFSCNGPSAGGPVSDSPDAPREESIELVAITLDDWRQEIAALRGEIVVVDMWATWCIPCIERFPHMVELSRRYANDGVRFVSTCLDDPGDEQAIAYARNFLDEQQATFDNYLIDENVADSFEKLDLMTIPAVFIYGRDGELSHRLTADDPNNQFTDQDVEQAIEALLRRGSV